MSVWPLDAALRRRRDPREVLNIPASLYVDVQRDVRMAAGCCAFAAAVTLRRCYKLLHLSLDTQDECLADGCRAFAGAVTLGGSLLCTLKP